jgi:adenylate cyclase
MSEQEIDRKVTVIFATDVVGYSKHMEADESGTVKNLRACEKILIGLFEKHKGRLFNTGGDSFLAEFPSAVAAVECAVEFQRAIKQRNSSEEASIKLQFRIGINSGDVIKEKDNLLGDGVNIAARLEALAQSGGITISKVIYDYVRGKTQYEFNDLGLQKIKQNEFHAFDLLLDKSQKRKLEAKGNKKNKTNISKIIVLCVLITVLALGFIASDYFKTAAEKPANSGEIADKPSVLIMPFENQTGAVGNNYLNNGITENLVTTLSKSKLLFIPSTHTGRFVLKNNLSDAEVRSEYGIKYILRGFIQGSASRLRISVQMTDTESNEVIWSEIYDFSKEKDIFDIQDEISVGILNKLNIDINSASIGKLDDFTNPEAFKKYVFARSEFYKFTSEGHTAARKLLDEASILEPENRLIKRFYGYWYWGRPLFAKSDSPEDDNIQALKIALEIEDYALAGYSELALGRQDEACKRPLQMANTGMLDYDVFNLAAAGRIQHRCGELEKALKNYGKSIELGPHYSSWVKRGYANILAELGKHEEAIEFIMRYVDSDFVNAGDRKGLSTVLIYSLIKTSQLKEAKHRFSEFASGENAITASQVNRIVSGGNKKSNFGDEVISALRQVGLND